MEQHNPPDALERALTDLYRTEIPDSYRAGWRAAIQREEQTHMKKTWKHKTLWRVALPIAAALVLALGAITAGNLIPTVVNDTLYGAPDIMTSAKRGGASPMPAGSGANGYQSDAMTADSAQSMTYAAPSEGSWSGEAETAASPSGSTADTAQPAQTAKIVRTADLTVATTAFDADNAAVVKLTESLGGYIASVSQYGEASDRMDRVAYYTLRIPSDQLDAFLNGMQSIGRITGRSETAQDMTTQYADTSMRLKTQQDKMTRLQELLKQAQDVSDLLEIESEIADTQYRLDSLESSLRTIDRDVDRSAVTLTLQEQSPEDTAQAVELTLWQRIGSGFEASIRGLGTFGQNLLVFLAMLLPALVPLAALAVIIWLILRARRKYRAAEPDSTPAPGAVAPDAAAPAPEAAKPDDHTPETK